LRSAQCYNVYAFGDFIREQAHTFMNKHYPATSMNSIIHNDTWLYRVRNTNVDVIDLVCDKYKARAVLENVVGNGVKLMSYHYERINVCVAHLVPTAKDFVKYPHTEADMAPIKIRFWLLHPDVYTGDVRDLDAIQHMVSFGCDNLAVSPSGVLTTIVGSGRGTTSDVPKTLEDIKMRVATSVPPAARMKKTPPPPFVAEEAALKAGELRRLGWTMLDPKASLVLSNATASAVTEDEVCVICLDECDGWHVKRSCCNARYHRGCYANVRAHPTSRRCPMCRQPMPM
jgi:hypothetical protein